MKTRNNIVSQLAGGAAAPLGLPVTNRPRPVRQGNFWPGESFSNCTRKWDLTGVFLNRALVLPVVGFGQSKF